MIIYKDKDQKEYIIVRGIKINIPYYFITEETFLLYLDGSAYLHCKKGKFSLLGKGMFTGKSLRFKGQFPTVYLVHEDDLEDAKEFTNITGNI